MMDGIRRMLVRAASRWRFDVWTKESGATIGIDPFLVARDRYFDTRHVATEYFAQEYGSRLRRRSDSPRQIHPQYQSSPGGAEGRG